MYLTPVRSLLTLLLVAASRLTAQPPAGDSARVTVRVTTAGRPAEAALVRSGSAGAPTDARGVATLRLAAGPRTIVASLLGTAPDSVAIAVRAGVDTTITIALQATGDDEAAELSGIVVTATRGSRRVEDEPTRVDVLDEEEIGEKTAMTPGNSAMLLSETGGVRVATTSPGLGGANVRIQGLRGRYTQLLSDGLPLLGLTTEGLGLLQIPPIDLRQVELIKGAASALYGPNALGGVVNFVSRRPPVRLAGRPAVAVRELYLNQTTLDGSDATLFDARSFGARWGATLLASANRQRRRDLNDDAWADVPGYRRALVRPRLFRTGADGGDLLVTAGLTAEDRDGGTLAGRVLADGTPFIQSRNTRRADAGAVAHVMLGTAAGGARVLSLRGSATAESRRATYGTARERDRRSTLFGEAAVTLPASAAHELVLGAAIQRDGFDPRDVPALAYTFTAPALFAQHTWTPATRFGLTTSARLDRHSAYGTTLSPRVSAVVRPRTGWTARLSGGIGTYAPTPFVEETEEVGLRRLRPLGTLLGGLRAERARSASADVGGVAGGVEMNAAVYASVIDRAVGARGVGVDSLELVNAAGPTRTHGAQLFARYRAGAYAVTGSYDWQRATEVDVTAAATVRRGVPLTPRHAAGLVASWEPVEGGGLSIENYYTGRQPLADDPYRAASRPYLIVGALARWPVGPALLFLNGENLGNVRQTRDGPLLRPTPGLGGRRTTDAWAPLDGAVVNAGARIRF